MSAIYDISYQFKPSKASKATHSALVERDLRRCISHILIEGQMNGTGNNPYESDIEGESRQERVLEGLLGTPRISRAY